MDETKRARCLERLGYDALWLTSGLLDEKLLGQQCRQLDLEEGEGETGRFRHAAFQQILQNRSDLDDATLDAYLALAHRDPDPLLGVAAVVELLRWPHLSQAHFDRLARQENLVDPRGRALVEETLKQMELLRALRADQIDDALFRRCLATAHPGIHAALIGHAGISDEQLNILRAQATTPRLRNLAAQTIRLRVRDHREK